MAPHSRCLGEPLPLFEPLRGEVIREPLGEGSGHWVGAPGVFHDPTSGRFYLTYRIREPRPVRGGITRIAVSEDGIRFEDIYECRKEALETSSIERCALCRDLDGRWQWFLSYVDPRTGQWRIDRVEADAPDRFDVARREKVFIADDVHGVEGIKDPWLMVIGRLYYLISSIGLSIPIPADRRAELHATGDIFNTGLTLSSTGLAVSHNGRDFRWLSVTDATRGAWDAYCFRINSLLYRPPVFYAFYDGSASVEENYEEKCGLAQGFDLRGWERVSATRPLITVPHGSMSVRYVDCVGVGEKTWYYYEMARPDGSHELRVCVV